MEIAIRIAIYSGIGLILIWVNVWYIKSVTHAFFRPQEPDMIAPFSLIGKNDPEGKLGAGLAHMLQSRIGLIQKHVEESKEALNSASGFSSVITDVRQVAEDRDSNLPIPVPEKLFKPMNLNLKVGEVSVGPLLSGIQHHLTKHRQILVTVEYDSDGKNALTVASFGAAADRQLWVTTKAGSSDIASALAYKIWQSHLATDVEEIRDMSHETFRQLIELLSDAVKLERQKGGVRREDWNDLLKRIEPMMEEKPDWEELASIALNIANRAKDESKIDRYLAASGRILRAQLEIKNSEIKELRAKNPKITSADRKRLESLESEVKSLASRVSDIETKLEERKNEREQPQIAVSTVEQHNERILELLGAAGVDGNGSGVTVAIVGGVAPTMVIPESKTIGERKSSEDPVNNYIGAMASAVQILAPDVEFVFWPMDPYDESTLTGGVQELIDAGTDLVLLPIRIPVESEGALATALNKLNEENITVIYTASMSMFNSLGEPEWADITQIPRATTHNAMVSAVDLNGKMAHFAQNGSQSLWSPGDRILVRNPNLQMMSGTGPAAALAAGLVARILEKRPNLEPAEIVTILRETSKSMSDDGPTILNLGGAVEVLGR